MVLEISLADLTGRPNGKRMPPPYGPSVTAIAFSPEGTIAVGVRDRAHLFDARGALLGTVELVMSRIPGKRRPSGRVRELAFGARGRALGVVGFHFINNNDGYQILDVFDVADASEPGKGLAKPSLVVPEILNFAADSLYGDALGFWAFDSRSSRLLAARSSEEPVLWDCSDPASPARERSLELGAAASFAAFEPSGERLALSSGDASLAVFAVQGGRRLAAFSLARPEFLFGPYFSGPMRFDAEGRLWCVGWEQGRGAASRRVVYFVDLADPDRPPRVVPLRSSFPGLNPSSDAMRLARWQPVHVDEQRMRILWTTRASRPAEYFWHEVETGDLRPFAWPRAPALPERIDAFALREDGERLAFAEGLRVTAVEVDDPAV